ncbi:MAG: cellulase family glycosylhydrolase [Ferruginibacter sp.]|nr:cellulase family glycosylhydrolase [Ferruginibacter sp.]
MKIQKTNAQIADEIPLYSPWPIKKINSWYAKNGWPVGCNYVPHNAINQLEMWQAETFSPTIIDKELSWAKGLGFNTIRVFLHHLLWEQDSAGFIGRMEEFLVIASKYGIKPMFVLFDGVWDPFPKTGKQPAPRNLVHNSGWVQSPGYDVLNDASRYDSLQDYVFGVINHFKDDERIFVWDIFNEPDNLNSGSYKDDNYAVHKAELSLALLKKAVQWIREIGPIQPITMAPWQCGWENEDKLSALDKYMFAQSDIISFHCYENKKGMEKHLRDISRYNRPMLCTEYMARPFKSTFKNILPLLKKYNVGAYNWGFVAGKSQTHIAWDSWHTQYEKEPELWFHDVLRADGKPYCEKEAAYLMRFNKKHAC